MTCRSLLTTWQPSLQFVRGRKINIQKPRPPHYERDLVLHVCKPILPRNPQNDKSIPSYETCLGPGPYFKNEKPHNPYEHLLAKELINWFNHSRMIVFFHRNPIKNEEEFDARLALKKKLQMRYKIFGKETMAIAVTGTKYEAVMNFFNSHTSLAFGPNPNVKVLLKELKKIPQLVLLGAVIDDRLLSRAELDRINNLPDLQTAQAQLVSVLNSAAQGVVSHLNHHQSQLVSNLKTYVDIGSKDGTSEG